VHFFLQLLHMVAGLHPGHGEDMGVLLLLLLLLLLVVMLQGAS
jgi:hypothetical protein